MGRLLLLFIVLPAAELALLIEFGSRFGTLHTLMLIVLTGMVGAALARSQGLGVMNEIQKEVAAGGMPAESLLDGVIILISAVLLMTPGILTDSVGFLGLIPGTRKIAKKILLHRINAAVRENRVHVNMGFTAGAHDDFRPPQQTVHEVIDVEGHTIHPPNDS
jgi:UPF0716 protein FxsA